MPFRLIRRFISMESSSGIILFLMTILALIMSNFSSLSLYYDQFVNMPFTFSYGDKIYSQSFTFLINDGLMTLFFLLVGLEIKRELCTGELNTKAKRLLPGFGAIGGMVVPAAVYIMINWHNPIALQGWAVPVATDIAFTLGLLSLLGSRVPFSLKIFLTALAILDDLGAIIIIAIFYTHQLSFEFLALSIGLIFILILFNHFKIYNLSPYLFVGIILTLCVIQSGIHSTIAGVIVACTIPHTSKGRGKASPLRYLEQRLHPWVAYIILPLFAFANAGVHFSLDGLFTGMVTIPIGIVLGLTVGKPIGIAVACWLAIKLRLATLPDMANWPLLWGTAFMCGIGFTMSLFIGGLAFAGLEGDLAIKLRSGVLIGSAIAGIVGYSLLYFCTKKNPNSPLIKGI
ncbi:MAG: Na+/H+ antiporter NhaA [Gammaproteobacteria bacterium]